MTTVIMYLRRVVKFLSRNPKFQPSYASTFKELVYSCWRLSRVWSSLWQLCLCFETVLALLFWPCGCRKDVALTPQPTHLPIRGWWNLYRLFATISVYYVL